jgi:hypothetical protein
MAIRFGASSPSTRVMKVRIRVTTMMATASAAVPTKLNAGTSGLASEVAANAEARKPARVMPIWMVARKRFGSRDRRASTRPPREVRSSRWIWLSRSDISAISLPDSAPLTRISASTSTTWRP